MDMTALSNFEIKCIQHTIYTSQSNVASLVLFRWKNIAVVVVEMNATLEMCAREKMCLNNSKKI